MTAVPERAGDLPPSSKLILSILQNNGWMTVNDLTQESKLNRTVLHQALQRLLDANLVERRPSARVPRGHEYRRL